ncbi:MAG: response regulator, partial [Acidobacteriota bacterium]|nr:response regulator [Acidobacteriota bacterium]
MGRKILLADDSITIQKVVNLTFSGEGIDVVAVGNGEVAIRKLNDVKPDLVLADVYMPGKNGYEVCEYIKTNPQFSRLPVLLLVGAFEPFDQAEAARVKADGHLTKPFESRTLIATVNRLLAQAPPPQQTESTAPPVRQQHLPPAGTVIRPNPTTVPSQYLSPEPPPMQSRPGTTPPAGVSNFPTSQFGFSTPVEGKPPVTKTEGFPGMLRPEAPEPPSFALDFNVSEEVPQQVQQTPPIKVPQRKLADFSAHFETEDMFEQTISIGVSELPKLQPQISQEPVGHTAESVDYDEAPLELEPLEEYSFQADSESLLEISDTSSVEAPQPSFEVSTPILEVPPVSQKVQEYEFVPTPTAWDVQESAASIPEQKFEFEAPVAEAE